MVKFQVLFISLLPACLLVICGTPQAVDGRTCDDMPCLRDEVCVMEIGRCDFKGLCERYPTCRVPRRSLEGSCEHYRCPPGQFCTLLEDRCVRKPCPSRPACVSSNHTGLHRLRRSNVGLQ
ncbi:uncharacterized protein LOC110838276 [Zootermopsis nevadensis]|uniref:Uncharacterized protein n=1 Tax=Zootermopsis nevadensis TaxID=136037 RepID=A0A067QYN9_ZOONE|nr:uncharacterized protein LOC110838276 [Zootermopsis nevadensis]KDR10084.1 hypothetical protein L798_15321 [Zootermopsis nevadensis]